ncbi:unnamed protein product [Strongylus vulgaris]|uniref:Clathrin light chain n=1 Tax=Strongylus vulgaris TaxID=40348 RepID=A0A3P7IPH2_STRVU|nr:unnamed protein product [Strongylus vulgaris]
MADPVADFLAREQDLFAEIDGAPPVGGPPVAPAGMFFHGFLHISIFNRSDFQAAALAADDLAALIDPPSVGGGDSGVDLAGMDYQPTPPVPLVNGNGVNSHQSAASSKGPSPVPVPRIEAENIRRWREQQKILLEKKEAQPSASEKFRSIGLINELRAAAKKELEDWYKQRDAALKLTKEANRSVLPVLF